MTDHDGVVTLLREANPAPTRPVEAKPTASEMLMAIQAVDRQTAAPRRQRRFAVAAVAAGFAATVIAVVAVATIGGEPARQPTTIPPTSSTTTSTVASSSTVPEEFEAIDPGVRAVLDEFASRYSSGDVSGVTGLLAPGTYRQTVRDAEEPHVWDAATMEYQIAVDAVLDTSMTIEDCRPLQSGSVACDMVRADDLTRIAGVGPQTELVTFRVVGGEITVWVDRRGFHATPYQVLAVAPFTEWLATSHPEIRDPYPLLGGVSHWLPQRPILEDLADLVAEYSAATRAGSS